MYKDYIVVGIIIILSVLLVVSLIKKAVKLLITIVLIVLAFSAYEVFAKGVSPIDELNGYKTNITYSIAIFNYTNKIQKTVGDLKAISATPKLDDATKDKIKEDSDNLHSYQKAVTQLNHTEGLNIFHSQYCGYVNTLVTATDTALAVSEKAGATISSVQKYINQADNVLKNITNLKMN